MAPPRRGESRRLSVSPSVYCPGRWKMQISSGTLLVNLPVTSCPSGVVSSYTFYVHKCLVTCSRCPPHPLYYISETRPQKSTKSSQPDTQTSFSLNPTNHLIRHKPSAKSYQVQGGLRRGGLTLALASRMPVITEDV